MQLDAPQDKLLLCSFSVPLSTFYDCSANAATAFDRRDVVTSCGVTQTFWRTPLFRFRGSLTHMWVRSIHHTISEGLLCIAAARPPLTPTHTHTHFWKAELSSSSLHSSYYSYSTQAGLELTKIRLIYKSVPNRKQSGRIACSSTRCQPLHSSSVAWLSSLRGLATAAKLSWVQMSTTGEMSPSSPLLSSFLTSLHGQC